MERGYGDAVPIFRTHLSHPIPLFCFLENALLLRVVWGVGPDIRTDPPRPRQREEDDKGGEDGVGRKDGVGPRPPPGRHPGPAGGTTVAQKEN